jgi:hypothetical protein
VDGRVTAYIAAGIRDSGVGRKAHVYDQFISKPGHIEKVRAFYDKRGIDRAFRSARRWKRSKTISARC